MAIQPTASALKDASVKFTIPPGWIMSASSISRKTYTQAFHFQTTIKGSSLTFKSDLDTTGLAHNPTYGRTDFFMTDHSASYDVVVSSYFDIGSAKLHAKAIRNPQYASTKFDLQTSIKPSTAGDEVPDYITYMIFVEDAPNSTQVASGSGDQFHDAMITINFVKVVLPPPIIPSILPPVIPTGLIRPTASTPKDASVKFTVPPGWIMSAVAMSRKTYTQAFHFETTIKGSSLTFKSDLDSTGLAYNHTYGRTDFFMTSHPASYDVVVSSYFDISATKLNAKAIRNSQYASTKCELQSSGKPSTAGDEVKDYITFIIFVEDAPNNIQVPSGDQFNDAMITINFVEANPNVILPAIPSTIASVVPSGLSPGLPTVLPIQPTASTPKDASVRFTVPPGWTMSASAISRKTYTQAFHVQTSILGGSATFKSDLDNTGPAYDRTHGKLDFLMSGRSAPYDVVVSSYFDISSGKLNAKAIRNPQYASTKFELQTTIKPLTAGDEVQDYITYIILVEDTPNSTQGVSGDQFNDAVITIHFVKEKAILPAAVPTILPAIVSAVIPAVRPSASTPKDACIKFTVPPGWTMSASTISRKTYTQVFYLQTSIPGSSVTFKSDLDSTGPGYDRTHGKMDFFMTGRSASYDVVVSSYFDTSSAKLNAKAIRNPQYASSKLELQTTVKPATASNEVQDYITYILLIQDAPISTQVADSDQFNDAVITIHFVKLNANVILPPIHPLAIPLVIPSVSPPALPSVVPPVIPSVAAAVVPSVIPPSLPTVLPSLLPPAIPAVLPTVLPTDISPPLSSLSSPSLPSVIPSVLSPTLPSVPSPAPPSVIPTVIPSVVSPALPFVTPPIISVLSPALPPVPSPASPPVIPSVIPSILSPALPSVIPPTISVPSPAPPSVPSPAPPSVVSPALSVISPVISVPSPTLPSIPSPAPPSVNPSVISPLIPSVIPLISVPSPALLSVIPPTLPSIIPSVLSPALPSVLFPALPSVISPALPSVVAPALPSIVPPVIPLAPSVTLPTVPSPALPFVIPPTVIPSVIPPVIPSIPSPALPLTIPTVVPSVRLSALPSLIPPVIPTVPSPVLPSVIPSAPSPVPPSVLPAHRGRKPNISSTHLSYPTIPIQPTASTPKDASVNITVPPGWIMSASAISRKAYTQAFHFQTSILGSSLTLTSGLDSTGPAYDPTDGKMDLFIAGRSAPYDIVVSAYFDIHSAKLNAKAIRNPQYASTKLELQTSVKPPTAGDEMQDYLTYMIFVKDVPGSTKVPSGDQFNDAVITIHFVKVNLNVTVPPAVIPSVIPSIIPSVLPTVKPTASTPKDGSVKITVPPGWMMSASAISRRAYSQAFQFQSTILGSSLTFKSGLGTTGPAYDPTDGKTDLFISGHSASYDVVISAYFDINSAKLNARAIRNPQYASTELELQTLVKSPIAGDEVQDYITYIMLVEDAPSTQVASGGQFNDAVITIHFVKLNPNVILHPIPRRLPSVLPPVLPPSPLNKVPSSGLTHMSGFPSGFFRIRSVSTNQVMTARGWNSNLDGNSFVTWGDTKHDSQIFWVDHAGVLRMKDGGRALDVLDVSIVIRFPHVLSAPWPNPWSHPLPQFNFVPVKADEPNTGRITVTFSCDPSVSDNWPRPEKEWKGKEFVLSASPPFKVQVHKMDDLKKWAPAGVSFEGPAEETWSPSHTNSVGVEDNATDLDNTRKMWELIPM